MKVILTASLLLCLPQISFAQITSVNTSLCHINSSKRVIAEVVEVERHPQGDPKYSLLRVENAFKTGTFETVKVRHAPRNFELFEGQHVLNLKRAHCDGEWYIEQSSHGEVVDAAEREQQKQLEASWASIEQQRCFGIIDRAYTDSFHPWTNMNEIPNECRKFKADYRDQFSLQSERKTSGNAGVKNNE